MTFNLAHIPSTDDNPHNGEGAEKPSAFETALRERYERLSLLTLDLAQAAGERAREGGEQPAPQKTSTNDAEVRPAKGRAGFDRAIASMSKAIWAHTVVERLRAGKLPKISMPPFYRQSPVYRPNIGHGPNAAINYTPADSLDTEISPAYASGDTQPAKSRANIQDENEQPKCEEGEAKILPSFSLLVMPALSAMCADIALSQHPP